MKSGYSISMLEKVWRCRNDGDKRRFGGLLVSIRNGGLSFEFNPGTRKQLTGRAKLLAAMLVVVSQEFRLPDVDFAIATGDHLYQSAGDRIYNGTFDPTLAPVLCAYRLQQDTGSVAVPDWSFFRHPSRNPEVGSEWDIDGHAALIREAADLIPWEKRRAKLFFMGTSTQGDLRNRVWKLALSASEKWGAIGVGPSAAHKTDDPESQFKFTPHSDHCRYKYLLNLAGNGASNRYKYLFFCNSTVVSPVRNGGLGGAGPGNELEEFFYHRIANGVNALLPPDVESLAETVASLRENDETARRIADAGLMWARAELTKKAASCYWAQVIESLAKLQRMSSPSGGPPQPTLHEVSIPRGVCLDEYPDVP
jgi:hypothetical protein